MHVIATAGHIDHGKSTLIRTLTGTDPDRLAEERRRGLTIELGHCSTTLPGAGDVAFVDVPGHERFIATMLSGVGTVPAVMFVVAADDPWMPQAAEHLAALDALRVRHGLLVVTRCDLADPSATTKEALGEIAASSLGTVPVVQVSGRTGAGMADLRAGLVALIGSLPAADKTADVRLWVDRSFSRPGAGTVVTGTLPAGTISVGDRLVCDGQPVRVRGLQSLHQQVERVTGVSRVAVSLGGNPPAHLSRGAVLLSVDSWVTTTTVDVRHSGDDLPERPLVHVGTATVGCRVRPLGPGAVRLALARALPLRPGDRLLLRDPGNRTMWGVTVLDPAPPVLRRRGAATRRSTSLATSPEQPDLSDELRRRTVVQGSLLRRLGVELAHVESSSVAAGGWLLDVTRVPDLRRRLEHEVMRHIDSDPVGAGPTTASVARVLRLPTEALLPPLLPPGWALRHGRVIRPGDASLSPRVEAALALLAKHLDRTPFAAPTRAELAAMGWDPAAVTAARRVGRILLLADGVVLAPGSDRRAAAVLAGLEHPFTVGQASAVLVSSRRVVLPLLALMDRRGLTRRLPDDRRELVSRGPVGATSHRPHATDPP